MKDAIFFFANATCEAHHLRFYYSYLQINENLCNEIILFPRNRGKWFRFRFIIWNWNWNEIFSLISCEIWSAKRSLRQDDIVKNIICSEEVKIFWSHKRKHYKDVTFEWQHLIFVLVSNEMRSIRFLSTFYVLLLAKC